MVGAASAHSRPAVSPDCNSLSFSGGREKPRPWLGGKKGVAFATAGPSPREVAVTFLDSFRRVQDDKLVTQGNWLVGSLRPTQDGKLTTQGSLLAGSLRRAQDGW